MMRAITDANDPRVQMQEPTLDMAEQFGQGTEHETDDTGAGIVEREMQVEVTSPAIRHAGGSTAPEEVNRDSVTPRRMNVHMRSGNANWSTGFDSKAAPEQTALVGTRDFLPGMGADIGGIPPWALIAGGAAAAYFLFLRK